MIKFLVLILIVILAAMCGLASAWTGSGGDKKWRRIFSPGIVSIFGILSLWSFWYVLLMARAGAISMGYGIPDGDDKGSFLGRFWLKIFPDKKKASIFTRATIGIIKSLAMLLIPIFTGSWLLWIAASMLIILNNIYLGAIKDNEGFFEFLRRRLLWEEFILEGLDTLIVLTLLILCR